MRSAAQMDPVQCIVRGPPRSRSAKVVRLQLKAAGGIRPNCRFVAGLQHVPRYAALVRRMPQSGARPVRPFCWDGGGLPMASRYPLRVLDPPRLRLLFVLAHLSGILQGGSLASPRPPDL